MGTDAARGPDHESKAKIFISYSRKDMAFADRLEAALKARGFEPLIDREEVYALEDWWKRIQDLIHSADTVAFLLSPDSVASHQALREVEYARSLNKRFAPVVCKRVQDSLVPKALQRLNFIFFDDPEHFEASTDQLAEALQTDISWIRRHTELGEAAQRWEDSRRSTGLLLRPPVLDQAEAWMAYRARGAPLPTAEIRTFLAESRKSEVIAKRRNELLHTTLYIALLGIIFGLIGWINESYISERWRWYSTGRPFVAANFWPYVLNSAAERKLKPKDRFKECTSQPTKDYCPEMIVVPAGSFLMGSPPNERDQLAREGPQHMVSIDRSFAVSKFELTFDEWDTCATYGDCPLVFDHNWGRGQRPVINVSWDDARLYVVWLSKMTGKHYRLLTEAEYEYATRAGTQTTYPWGDDIGKDNANCNGCGSKWDNRQTAPVGSFAANGFGLYDMVGNVWEWVEDCAHYNYDDAPTDGSASIKSGDCKRHLIRGGSWDLKPPSVRSASRYQDPTGDRGNYLGFRAARTLAP